MKKVLIFDLDDTLLWDKKSVEEALRKTCMDFNAELAIDLQAAVREQAPKLYQMYPFYEFTQKVGINPFEGLWGKFPDEQFDFPVMAEKIGLYQLEVWTTALREVGHEADSSAEQLAQAFIDNRKSLPFLYEESLIILEELSQKYTLALLTNGAPSLQNLKLDLSSELKPYFKEIVISGDVGIGKPDSVPFAELLNRLRVEPEDAIMIGDNLYTDILGANRYGIETIWINHHQTVPPEHVKPTHTVSRLSDIRTIV